jgi:hypothetical protein
MKTFLNFYQDQINVYQPDFYSRFREDDLNIFVLRDMVPAGLLVGNLNKDGTLVVELDFVVPQYRDFKVGKFLFEENKTFFNEEGIEQIVAKPGSQKHNEYLEEMGFNLKGTGKQQYQLTL